MKTCKNSIPSYSIFCALGILFLLNLSSCVTVRIENIETIEEKKEGVPRKVCSRNLTDEGVKKQSELVQFFLSENPEVSIDKINRLAGFYIEEASSEGINSDCAFVQMCLETGFLSFGNLVTMGMNNFCGLGAMDAQHPGECFATEQLGVRAHVQHLHAYATDSSVKLNKELVDPRYSWVHKAKSARNVQELAGQWAMDAAYGDKLDALLTRLDDFTL